MRMGTGKRNGSLVLRRLKSVNFARLAVSPADTFCACQGIHCILLLLTPTPLSIPWSDFFPLSLGTALYRQTQTAGLTHNSSHDLPDNSLRAHTWAHNRKGREKKRDQRGAPGWSLEALQTGDTAGAAAAAAASPYRSHRPVSATTGRKPLHSYLLAAFVKQKTMTIPL